MVGIGMGMEMRGCRGGSGSGREWSRRGGGKGRVSGRGKIGWQGEAEIRGAADDGLLWVML